MLRLLTGRNRALGPALLREVGDALKTEGDALYVVVPKQLTLQTERTLLRDLNQRGSFQIQVLSPERLCARIFDAAGQPEGVRVDDRGRVMLVRAAVRAAGENLTLYRGAERRRGFPERCAAQLERIRQAGVTADTLRACAADLSGMDVGVSDAGGFYPEGFLRGGLAIRSGVLEGARQLQQLRVCHIVEIMTAVPLHGAV